MNFPREPKSMLPAADDVGHAEIFEGGDGTALIVAATAVLDVALPAAILGRIDVVVAGQNGANDVLAVCNDADKETAAQRSGRPTC